MKIMYLAEETWRKQGVKADIQYRSSLPVIFGVKKYADALWEVVKGRNINVNLRQHLIEVSISSKLNMTEIPNCSGEAGDQGGCV